MAVEGKARKAGKKSYYVVVKVGGRKFSEPAGKDVREARRLNRLRLQEKRDGVFVPRAMGVRTTVAEYGEAFLARRTARWTDGATYLKRYVLECPWLGPMRIEDVRKAHALRLLDELRVTVSKARGTRLSEKTCANIVGMACTMFADALDRELVTRNPFSFRRGTIDREAAVPRETYDVTAIRRLLSNPNVHPVTRVFACIAFFTGMREGEIAGRRWKDLDMAPIPLAALHCWSQYNDRPLKTARKAGARARFIPVHPALAAVLTWWRETGWRLAFMRDPEPEDFIVPRRGAKGHTKSSAYKAWRAMCDVVGVKNVSLHSTRHTFCTLAGRHARKDLVEKISHNAKGGTIDRYTHPEWEPLCGVMLALDLGEVPTSVQTPHLLMASATDESLVEAPGIETGRVDATTPNDTDTGPNEGSPQDQLTWPKVHKTTDIVRTKGAARRHSLPPGLVATRVEVDDLSETVAVRPGDTPSSLHDRVASAARAAGARVPS